MGDLINFNDERRRRQKTTPPENVVDLRKFIQPKQPFANDNKKETPIHLPKFNSDNPEIKKVEDIVKDILLDASLRESDAWDATLKDIVRISAQYAKYSRMELMKALKGSDKKNGDANPPHFVMLAEAYCEKLRKLEANEYND